MKSTQRHASVLVAIVMLVSLCAAGVSVLSSNTAAASGTEVQASVAASVQSAPAVCSQGANSLDLFIGNKDTNLWWRHYDSSSGWGTWTSLGGSLTSSPAAASWSSGRIDVCVRGSDGAIWHKWYQNGWSKWESLGGSLASGTGPALSSWGSGHLDIFGVGTNNAIWQKTWQSRWSGWTSLGGTCTSSPGAASSASGRIDLFVRGSSGALYQKSYNNGWSGWSTFGGSLASGTGPAVSSWGSGRLDVFAEGTNKGLWQRSFQNAWSAWNSLGGTLTSSPAAVSWGSGRIDVFVRGSDGALWQKSYNNGWSGWTPVDNTLQSAAQTLYYVPQAGSAWTNRGTAGSSYNTYVSTPGLFKTQSNGYPYWGDIGKNDFVCVPAGSATNNPNLVSWEIGFHFSGIASDASATSAHRYQKIWDKAYGAFGIKIDTEYGPNKGLLTIFRATTGGGHVRWYIPTDTMLRVGHNYYVQISWDTRAGPGNESYPTVWIGEDANAPVKQTHWDETGGALDGTGAWYDDSVGTATLGVTSSGLACGSSASAKTDWLIGGFYVYRQYNSIVDFSKGGSWNTDKLAWTT